MGGSAVRLGDVAQVVDSVQDLRNDGLMNGRPSVLLVIGAACLFLYSRFRAEKWL